MGISPDAVDVEDRDRVYGCVVVDEYGFESEILLSESVLWVEVGDFCVMVDDRVQRFRVANG